MNILKADIEGETQIGKLKLLITELNRKLPSDQVITGYSTYKLAQIEELRKLALSKLNFENSETKETKETNKISINSINSINSLSGLKDMARLLGISGFSGFKANRKEELRALIIANMNSKKAPPFVPAANTNKEITEMTVNELKAFAANKGIYIKSKSNKAEIIQAILKGGIPNNTGEDQKAPPVISNKEITEMTVNELKAFAANKGIYIKSKSNKAEIIQAILKGGIPNNTGEDQKKNVPGVCVNRTLEKLTTSPFQEWKRLTFTQLVSGSVPKCLGEMGLNSKKLIGRGSAGNSYFNTFKGNPSIFKVVKLPGLTGIDGFRWECIINERAAAIGVGPVVLEKSICLSEKTPKFGVLVLEKCSPISTTYNFSEADCAEIYNLIDRLHQNGISHRDLGARNIMKSGNGFVLIDYGLSLAFDGPVPEEYEFWDHLYLSIDVDEYYNYLKSIKSDIYMSKLDKYMSDNVKLELLTVKHFPDYMLKTLGFDAATNYLNNVDGPEAVIVDRALKVRIANLQKN